MNFPSEENKSPREGNKFPREGNKFPREGNKFPREGNVNRWATDFRAFRVIRAQEVERGLASVYPKGETLVSFLSLTTDNAALSVVGGLCF